MKQFTELSESRLRACIRDIPDFPKPGIVFKDITPLLADAAAYQTVIQSLSKRVSDFEITKVVAIESRGFLFGAAVAYELGAGLVIVRKPKKLPYQTAKIEFALEYGSDTLEMHVDSLTSKDRVLIVDDVLATGGTARAAAQLVELMGAKVQALAFLLELGFLEGRKKLNEKEKEYPIVSLLNY